MTPDPRLVYRRLLGAYGPQGWWPVTPVSGKRPRYRPGFWGLLSERERLEICVGAILAQNTNWKNAEAALEKLTAAKLWSVEALARVPVPRLSRLIRSSGYFNQKALKIKAFIRHAARQGRGLGSWLSHSLPVLREELLGLWGIGPETADSILLYAGGRLSFVIDAYTLRVGARLGWFREKPAYERARDFMMKSVTASARVYAEYHALIVELAKRHCRATPACPGCPLLTLCAYARNHPTPALT